MTRRSGRYWPEILLFLLFFGSRVVALDALPLHNDEGQHLTRGVEVWNLHPFYDIEDGKIAGAWVIALFYPQSSPVFAGRVGTIFVTLIGFAAGMALGRLASRRRIGGLVAGGLWLSGPYLFFFERMALADIEAGAAVVVLTLAVLPGIRSRRADWLAGLALGIALMFKISAAPFVIVPLLAMLFDRGQSWRTRIIRWATIYGVALVVVAPATLYTATRGGFYSIALGWVGGPTLSISQRTALNMTTLVDTFGATNGLWILALIGVPLSVLAGRRGLYILSSVLIPLVVLIVFGREVLDRHFGVIMPLLTVTAAVGWSRLKVSLPSKRMALAASLGAMVVIIAWAWGWAWRVAYTDPASFPMTEAMREQYVSQHPSGYALREAVRAFPQTVGVHKVIASMTSDGCRRARFYLPAGQSLECTAMGEQGREPIEKALQADGTIYVLAESQPIGIDPKTINATWTPLAVYPRPGDLSRVTLWRVSSLN